MELPGLVGLRVLVSVLCVVCGSKGHGGCECPSATITHHFTLHISNQTCCLNFTGSSFSRVSWSTLGSSPLLQILDLSFCNVSLVEDAAAGSTPVSLREVYLNQNQLTFLPPEFLGDAVGLEVLDLGQNLLEELPEHFLKNAEHLQVLVLSENRLKSLPVSVLKLPLLRLGFSGNPWTCSCSFVEDFSVADQSNSSRLQQMAANLTCSSPESLSGRVLRSVQVQDVCRLSGLSALFILLPLLAAALLMLFWCCGRKEEKKDSQKTRTAPIKNTDLSNESTKNCVLRNQLMIRPSSALLGSTRDIYEEVEVKPGSVDSLGPSPSTTSVKAENQEVDGKQDLETVSVSEVMRDSADREKAYMIQSTKYYILVPGLEIDDSDHGEYESVDLS